MKLSFFIAAFIFAIFISCQNIETGDTLKKETVNHIKSLGLLDENEKILKFYSNFKKEKAGNFFTNKRIAHYWLDDHDDSKTDVSFAYYQDIRSIDTTFTVYDFDIPYMTVEKKDSTTFRVYIDGTVEQRKAFFEEAINIWKKSNNLK